MKLETNRLLGLMSDDDAPVRPSSEPVTPSLRRNFLSKVLEGSAPDQLAQAHSQPSTLQENGTDLGVVQRTGGARKPISPIGSPKLDRRSMGDSPLVNKNGQPFAPDPRLMRKAVSEDFRARGADGSGGSGGGDVLPPTSSAAAAFAMGDLRAGLASVDDGSGSAPLFGSHAQRLPSQRRSESTIAGGMSPGVPAGGGSRVSGGDVPGNAWGWTSPLVDADQLSGDIVAGVAAFGSAPRGGGQGAGELSGPSSQVGAVGSGSGDSSSNGGAAGQASAAAPALNLIPPSPTTL